LSFFVFIYKVNEHKKDNLNRPDSAQARLKTDISVSNSGL
jgi:hypothetical protein